MASPAPSPAGLAEIQPRGFLLALALDWQVVRASTNVSDFVAGLDGSAVGRPLTDLLGHEAVHGLRNRFSLLRDADGIARQFAVQTMGNSVPLDVMMHLAGNEIILEAQPRTGQESGDPIGLVRDLARRLDGHPDIDRFLGDAARQLRALTGFECVSLFRWNEAGKAELASHCARGDMQPVDPPTIAGRHSRFISEGGAAPVRVLPDSGSVLLDRCLLRAPTDSERARMGPAASMLQLPLQAGNDRLGVAVCTDRSPRQLSMERMAAAELFAELVAFRLALRGR